MGGRDVALGDRDEAGQSRLGGEEVVAVRVRIALEYTIADREEVARGIEEKAELHGLEVLAREPGEGEQATDERAAGIGRALEALGERGVRGPALRLGEPRPAAVGPLDRGGPRGAATVSAVALHPLAGP